MATSEFFGWPGIPLKYVHLRKSVTFSGGIPKIDI
jgi:hypothetical protein